MSSSNKNSHLTLDERMIIEKGIHNNSSKSSIADTIGKDKSTIGKEIKLHRKVSRRSSLSLECSNYKKCKHGRHCSIQCEDYLPFKCTRRDRSPGACNGCESNTKCRFTQYKYSADIAHKEYLASLVDSRVGIDSSREEIIRIGNLIKPLIEQGQSIYVIKKNHPNEIPVSEKTLYNYIEWGVFQKEGISIKNIDLVNKVARKPSKNLSTTYKQRQDRSFLKGRTKDDCKTYMDSNPNAHIVQMDTVYNDVTNGPFLQTFKFLKYDLLIIVYHEQKTSDAMYEGILYLEKILGKEIMEKEVEVLLTDRGSEFYQPERIETREDGTTRTRMYYCDPMASWQKGSLENIHELIRRILPKCVDLYTLGFHSQQKAILVASHINSYPKEKLDGKSAFQLANFYNHALFEKLMAAGFKVILPDEIILKPYLVK